ncbi:MAG: LysM peptidoglycan-binding domain-containing protein [Desulfuromonadaceae bacterium]|nr:LysM peptidoglycan-binding domain-containing protein [Desulfuromonadaceae bacterium]
MTPCRSRTIVIALLTSLTLPAWGEQYFLYSPHPVTTDQRTASADGILVREIVIQKGDTLSGLSRKFNGRGMYFPQILLFNSITNPDLIYYGKSLRIPVIQKGRPTVPSPVSASASELSLSGLKTVAKGKKSAERKRAAAAAQAKKSPAHAYPAAAPPASLRPVDSKRPAADQELFEAAAKAYRQGDCRTAIELLDRYLAANPGSPLAADANLYKADCYLKLSAQ